MRKWFLNKPKQYHEPQPTILRLLPLFRSLYGKDHEHPPGKNPWRGHHGQACPNACTY